MMHVLCQAGLARLLPLCLLGLTVLGATTHALAQKAAAPEREVSLPELLAFAERNAPTSQRVLRREGYGDAARTSASPLFRENPNLQIGVGPRFNRASERDFDFVASLGQSLEIAGERRLRRAAATRLGERLEAETSATRWEVRREIVVAYGAAVVARQRWAVSDRRVRFADRMLTVAQKRFDAGDATMIDVRIAQTDVAQARQAKLAAEGHLRSTRIVLAEVSGWSIEAPPNVMAGLKPARPVPSLEVVMQTAADHHPELKARKAATAEAQVRVELADREAWPTPVLGVQVAREGSAGSPANYIVLGTLGVPLTLWQRNQGERAQRRVEQDLARADESATARTLRARIARAHAELASASDRLALFTSSVTPQLEESLSLLQRGFDAGELPLLNVALARERFLAAQEDALSAYADYYRSLAELEFALGAELPNTSLSPPTDAR